MSPTSLLMRASALVLALLGLVASFAPDVVLARLGAPVVPAPLLLVQLLGAAHLGFAMLNWMARASLIGGIYSRPVAIGNLAHFLVGGLAAGKLVAGEPALRMLWPLAAAYLVLAAAFGVVLVRHPVRARG